MIKVSQRSRFRGAFFLHQKIKTGIFLSEYSVNPFQKIPVKELIFLKRSEIGRRSLVRLISYALTLFVILAAWGGVNAVRNKKNERQLLLVHQRAISSLSSYLNTIETDLQKMQYVNTPTMATGLSMSLCKASAGAKNCLSELSAGGIPLDKTYKFLSQSGDYVQSLNKRMTAGENFTEDDRKQLSRLYDYAKSLAEQTAFMEEVMYAGSINFDDTISTLSSLAEKGDLEISYKNSVSDAEDTFSDYPTLIYDGPFSDNMLNGESEMLKNEEEISESEAKKRAALYSNISENKLIRQEDEKGHIPAYVYYCEGTSVAVTKNGGYLMYLLSDKYAGESKLDEKTAVEKARQYLEKFGYVSLKDSYYSNNDGICTVNFAYTADDVICYADLIKVCVALDNGSIISADATGYLMHHKQRPTHTPALTAEKAAESISSNLTVARTGRAIIPINDGNEVFTYEFLCKDKNGSDVLVYINADTGKEADIKLLLYTDGGVLTR